MYNNFTPYEYKLSVIIVSYNTKEMTLRCIQSVLDNSYKIPTQIIIVDNKSSDGSSQAIKKAYPNTTVIDSPTNSGFASGNNQGFEKASGEYLLLLNPDSIVFSDTLEKSLNYIESNSNIGILGCKVIDENEEIDPTIFRFLNISHVLINCFIPSIISNRFSFLGDYRYSSKSFSEIQDVDVVAGCFMLIKHSTLKTIGGLDERFFMYGEEAEWCYRIKKHGLKVVFFPFAKILHYGGASSAGKSSWQLVEMARGQLTFLYTTQGFTIYYISNILMFIRDLIRIPIVSLACTIDKKMYEKRLKPMAARLSLHFKKIFRPSI